MGAMGRYILGIGAAALIIAILTGMTDRKSATGTLIRMVFGLFLAIVAIKPVANLNYDYLEGFVYRYDSAAEAAATNGMKLAEEARLELIKEKAEAYILDKARLYGLKLSVQVTLSQGEIPEPDSVTICGEASPYARTKLTAAIADELGIPKERQVWIG